MSFREKVYEFLEDPDDDSIGVWIVNGLLIGVLFVDLLCFALESSSVLSEPGHRVARGIEKGVLFVFTAEYLVRLWASGANPRYRGLRGRMRFALRPFSLVDLVAILPVINLLPGLALPVSHQLPAVRVVRLVKLLRYSHATRVLMRSVLGLRRELGAFFLLVSLLIVLASIFVFEAEREVNSEAFPTLTSAGWWSIVTITTVGYGDQVPVTPTGRAIGVVVMICGIGMFALPAGLLGAAFTEESRRERAHKRKRRERRVEALRGQELEEGSHVACPDCGLEFRPRGHDFR